jgi:signal peptidase I
MEGALTQREILAFGLGGLVALAGFNMGVAQARMVPSGSMAPTFLEGDRLLVVPRTGPVHRGDVVVFKPSFGEVPGSVLDDSPYIKRCVAIAGDTVQVRAGEGLWINGRLQQEPYVLEKPRYNWGPEVVPAGALCMLGDNRNNSFDSHYWGFLRTERVSGAPAAVIWPPRRARRL